MTASRLRRDAFPRVWMMIAIASAVIGDLLAGCGSVNGNGPAGNTSPDGGTDASQTGGDAAGPDGTLPFGDANASCTTIQCSADLHQVVDCNGNVIKQCPSDQGCAPGGECVAPCDAAKANGSAIGCEYYPHPPSPYDCYAIYLVNTWGTPVSFTADAGGTPIDIASHAYIPNGTGTSITYTPLSNGQIPPGAVAIVFLRNDGQESCPEPPAVTGSSATWSDPVWTTAGAATGASGQSLHVTTSAPVVAYDIWPYGGGASAVASATLLLPTATWDTNYVDVTVVSHADSSVSLPQTTLIASQDDTDITIKPTTDIVGGGGLAPIAANAVGTYHLDKAGQVLTLQQTSDFIGSVIQSTKPIGMWAETNCFTVDEYFCDSGHQQVPPIHALGSEYVGVRYRNRIDGKEETPPWRVVGLVNGTTLTYDPSPPTGAPTTIDLGQVVTFRSAGPFVVKSQDDNHPFYMNAYMTGGGGQPTEDTGCDASSDPECFGGRGDPEFVNIVSAKQYLPQYTFFTDPTYPETDLVFVRALASDGTFHDVTLDCAGTLTGWQPVGTAGAYQYLRVDLVRHNFQPQGGCNNGRHAVDSDTPFGLTVWGWGTEETGVTTAEQPGYSLYVSYAYPAGMSVRPINTVVVPPGNQ